MSSCPGPRQTTRDEIPSKFARSSPLSELKAEGMMLSMNPLKMDCTSLFDHLLINAFFPLFPYICKKRGSYTTVSDLLIAYSTKRQGRFFTSFSN